MSLMYHHLDEGEGEWRRSYENFWQDLEYLYENGYRPISLSSYLSGHIDLPEGMSPVILTFDDGLSSHLRWVDDVVGEPHPQTVVGILCEFSRQHHGFEALAVFYINSPRTFYPMPREQIDESLTWLIEQGFELGNHTHWHADLSSLPDDEVQKVIANTEAMITEAVPGYQLQSLALPFGLWPPNRELAFAGSWRDASNQHEAVMLVGAEPAPSPLSHRFDPRMTPRIQATSQELGRWFGEMEADPQTRYVSDGDPLTVSIPAGQKASVDPDILRDRMIREVE